jgi:NAD-dependent SIR2 family protein deacetylase
MRIALALCIVVVTLAGMAAPLAADDFRIETKVYAGKDKVSHNTTLFEAGYVYDYLSDPERVAVFDQHHGRFIVLDPVRKVKSEVKTVHEFRRRPRLPGRFRTEQ